MQIDGDFVEEILLYLLYGDGKWVLWNPHVQHVTSPQELP